jgi:hypothetical protein
MRERTTIRRMELLLDDNEVAAAAGAVRSGNIVD